MSYDQHIIDYLRNRLQSAFGERLKQILLFGSRARGDAEEDSDYDVLVLLESREKTDDAILVDIAVTALTDYEVVFSLFAFKDDCLELHPFEPLFMNVRREGVTL